MLMALVDELGRGTGLAPGRIVLGGFSQGAMVATDVALRLEEPPAALVVLSGTLLCQDEWRRRAVWRFSHGDQQHVWRLRGVQRAVR